MIINGKEAQYEEGMTVEELLHELKVDDDKVVVELDRNIVSRDEYSLRRLSSSSEVEIIRFVGGG